MRKIYIQDNYIIVENPDQTKIVNPRRNVKIYRQTSSELFYYKTRDETISFWFYWTNMTKEDGTSFADIQEFETFITENTGNFNSGSSGGTIDPQDYDLADFNNASANPFVQESDLLNKADLVGGKVPSSQLPSYVDDVIEEANLAAFPNPGETGKIYVALDTNRLYRWTGSNYIEVSSSSITTSGNAGQVSFFTSPTNISSDSGILWDNTNKRLAVGVTSPTESIDTNTLRARSLPDGNSDATFTRSVITRNNGTFGWETRPTPTFYPKVTINSYTQDASDYILKVTVSNLPPESYSSAGGLFNVSVFGSNPLNAANITATNDSILGYANNIISLSPYIALGSFDFTIKFPKASNTSPIWNNQNALIAVAWRGTDNADGGTSSPYKPRRLANDGKLIGELGIKQDALISGTNIKTINGVSILGSGNIAITQSGTEIKQFFDAFTGTTLTLTNTPKSGTIVNVIENGIILREGATRDYTISGSTVTLTSSRTNIDIEINYTY